ncbi:tigger transposable element-derived protein 6-like [Bemisia tabaci]|uniref:tigger transposable element-derived protein 6-like n=1 Tax=Bemisia tabaci TaxID=7038 RepID=UPI003B28D949
MPNKTITFKNEKCSGGKFSKKRITVLVCTNRDGSDKRKLLVIGKSKKPRCFKRGCLPPTITYANNKKAWMTGELFSKWLVDFDKEMTKEKRKILLIIDNCTAHNVDPTLNSIELLYLPPNTTSKLQPANQGIIQNMKVKYRARLVERLLVRCENNLPMEVDLLSGIQMFSGAWSDVRRETVENCWKHAFGKKVIRKKKGQKAAENEVQENDDPETEKEAEDEPRVDRKI